MRSGIGRSLEPRERRTIAAGATVVALAAVVVLVVRPLVHAWTEREDLIEARRDRLGRLAWIAGREDELLGRTQAIEWRLDAGRVRLVRARSVPLAASALQSMVREYAQSSVVTVTRLDAAGAPVPGAAGMLSLPAILSVQADIYGMSDFLRRLQYGPWLVELTNLTIAPNPVLRGNLLQVSISLRAPIALEP